MSDSTPAGCAGDGASLPPNPNPDWSQDDPAHPGFVVHGLDDTPGPKAYYIHLEAKPGKEDLLQAFLRDINAGVDQEPGTGPWFSHAPACWPRRRCASSMTRVPRRSRC